MAPTIRSGLPRPVPRTTWDRLLAFGRRWPNLYRKAHLAALCLLPVELITGACLYFPALHTGLIRWLPWLETLHVWGGVAFGVLLLLPLAVPLGRRILSVLDWTVISWCLGGLTVTGLLLWVGFDLWPPMRAGAFAIHGILAILLLAWILYHGLMRWLTAKHAGDMVRVGARRTMARREILLTLERAILGGAFISAAYGLLFDVRPDLVALQAAKNSATESGGATAAGNATPPLPGFQLYTVVGDYPGYDPTTYRLRVDGDVARPLALSLDDLRHTLPQVRETRNFHCVTGWIVPDVLWQGVPIANLLRLAGASPASHWLTFYSFDGVYTDSLSVDQATATGVLLAHSADGRPLARQQGAPLRLFVPQMYGYKSVKWLARIQVVKTEVLGYWEQRGYGPNAYLGTDDGWPPGKFPNIF